MGQHEWSVGSASKDLALATLVFLSMYAGLISLIDNVNIMRVLQQQPRYNCQSNLTCPSCPKLLASVCLLLVWTL